MPKQNRNRLTLAAASAPASPETRAHALLLDASSPGIENKSLAGWLAYDGSLSRAYFQACHAVLRPGAMGVVLVPPVLQASVGLSARLAGFELRDVFAVFADKDAEGQESLQGAPSGLLAALLIQKELDKTFANNALAWGCGALNIDGARIGRATGDRTEYGRGHDLPHANTSASLGRFAKVTAYAPADGGRWPANLILGNKAAMELDARTGVLTSRKMAAGTARSTRQGVALDEQCAQTLHATIGDSGGASRFFKGVSSHEELLGYLARLLSLPTNVGQDAPRLLVPDGSPAVEGAARSEGWRAFDALLPRSEPREVGYRKAA